MVAEARLAVSLGRLDAGAPDRIARACEALGCDPRPPEAPWERMCAALAVAKKRRGGLLRVSLPTRLGAHDPAAPTVEATADDLLSAL